MENSLEQMRDLLVRHVRGAQAQSALPGLVTAVARRHGRPEVMTCSPGVCLVLQGTKRLVVGDDTLQQNTGMSFGSSIELPATRCVFATANGEPYVAVGLTIDVSALAGLINVLPKPSRANVIGSFSLAATSNQLLEAWANYVGLLDTPADIAALAPPRERELLYRLLQSPHGPLLRQMVRDDDRPVHVLKAIDWIRAHFDEPLPVKMLADLSGMSVPSFIRHFRAATSTSPLNYQKTLRLQAARHLLARNHNATETAYAVGYGSPSQFSREYTRHFGRSPKRDSLSHRDIDDLEGLI